MRVSEAILSRHSIRAFLDKPVARNQVEEILEIARYAPTGGNLQPWRVYVAAGESRARLISKVAAELPDNPLGRQPEYHVYPSPCRNLTVVAVTSSARICTRPLM